MQHRTGGTAPRPFWGSIKEFSTSCSQPGWDAVARIARLLPIFRERGWPISYPNIAPKEAFDTGRLAAKVPALMGVAAEGYEFVPDIAPQAGDVLLPKRTPAPSSARRRSVTWSNAGSTRW